MASPSRLLAPALLSVTLFAPAMYAQQSPPWADVVEKLEKSVVQLGANCSGFTINTEKHYVLTAAHCGHEKDLDKSLLVDSRPAKVVAVDVHRDFLVVEVPDLERPQLQMAERNPSMGEQLASYGFGYGYERPMLRFAYISQNKALVPDAGPGEWLMVDAAFVGGMSGGPLVNARGEVVMIVQMASDRIGLGRGIEQIRDRVGRYWGTVRQ
jgi:S1-C subfamily serine protease